MGKVDFFDKKWSKIQKWGHFIDFLGVSAENALGLESGFWGFLGSRALF